MLGTSLDSRGDSLSPDCVVGSCGLHLLKGFILRFQKYRIASTSPDSSDSYRPISTGVPRNFSVVGVVPERPATSSDLPTLSLPATTTASVPSFSIDGTLSVTLRASVVFFEPHLRSQFPERLPAEPDVVLTDEALFASRHPADVSVIVSRIVRLLGSTVFLQSISCHD